MRLILATILIFTFATTAALAAEEVLQLKSGKLAVGVIKGIDAKGVQYGAMFRHFFAIEDIAGNYEC